MPHWLEDPQGARRLAAASFALSLALGGVAAAASIWWSLHNGAGRFVNPMREGDDRVVVEGDLPVTELFIARRGVLWMAAADRVAGLEWWNLERLSQRAQNHPISVGDLPAWAEPPDDPGPPGGWQIGTLAAGWPWFAVAREWQETESDRGFIPHQEVDDDGTSLAKATERFWKDAPDSRFKVLWTGMLANVAFFTIVAWPLSAVAVQRLRRRSATSS
ncbi:MAG: hypothetical protein SGJ11_06515 [Phycisphaerae bacterium]|nr:hypothetical protein [Phycisphaerae bacterium]